MATKLKTTEVGNLSPMPDDGRPYIRESAEFDAYVDLKKREAESKIRTLDIEISRLQKEIEGRLIRRQDLMTIVIKADAVLQTKDITPKLPES